MLINLSVFSLLIANNLHHTIAAIIAFFFAVTNNYLWNSKWTFKDKAKDKSEKRKYVQFLIISAINLGLNLIVLELAHTILTNYVPLNEFLLGLFSYTPFNKLGTIKLLQILSQMTGIAAATLFNFFGNYYITFRNAKEEKANEKSSNHHTDL